MNARMTVAAALVAATAVLAPSILQAGDVRTIELVIHHSRFQPAELRVEEGTRVRFVVRNLDPIDHELIVGGPEVHDRHEEGTERHHHGEAPGEVSVPIGQTAETTYTFGQAGQVLFACHLPGHFRYGMRGTVRVTPVQPGPEARTIGASIGT